MKKIFALLIISMSVLAISSCQCSFSDEQSPSNNPSSSASQQANHLSTTEAQSDIQQTFTTLRNAWSYQGDKEVDLNLLEKKYLERTTTDITSQEFYLLVQELIADLQEGHAQAIPSAPNEIYPYMLPFSLVRTDSGLLIQEIFSHLSRNEIPLQIGDQVLSINQEKIEDRLLGREKYVSASTHQQREYLALKELIKVEQKNSSVQVLRDGETINLSIEATYNDPFLLENRSFLN